MRRFEQNKLWRDDVIESLEKTGSVIHWQRLNDVDYDQQLRVKLIEEADEVVKSTSTQELKGELADVMEVIDALCALHGLSFSDVVIAKEKKRRERGGFAGRKFVTVAEHVEGSFGEQYCLAQPDKYKEILS